jgi:hypothetical protein
LETVRALLEGVVDYAGLFPPASLAMADAVANYRAYRSSYDRWLLGRFIVPATRLGEFQNLVAENPPGDPWNVSVLVGADVAAAIPAVLAFNTHAPEVRIDWIEARAESPASITDRASAIPDGFVTYWEIPVDTDPAPLLETIGTAKGRAKIRTGGVGEDLFPTVAEVARFIRRCDEFRIPFKATAGLHHSFRGVYSLTYEPGAPTCMMHGFLNLWLAAAFLWAGISDSELIAILEERAPSFAFSRRGAGWGDRWISADQVHQARERLAISFGSCSFEEPVEGLRALNLL